MMRWARFFAGGAVLLFASQAQAATVSIFPKEGTPKGSLLLSRGAGYQPLTQATTAQTGDSVMAMNAGAATIVYEDGCRVEVTAATSVVFIAETSPCKPGLLPSAGTAPFGTYAVGAAVVGGAIAAIVILGGGDDGDGGSGKKGGGGRKPASP